MKEKHIQWYFCRIPIFICMAVFLVVLFFYFGKDADDKKGMPKEAASREEEEKFLEFTKKMFRKEAAADGLTLNYTLKDPLRYGVSGGKGFGAYSLEAMKQGVESAGKEEEELKAIDRKKLSEDSRFLYDILMEEFENCREQEKYLYFSECLRPKSGVTAQLPMLLTEYHFYRQENIEEYLELLEDIPRYFEDIMAFQELKFEKGLFMNDEWAGEIIAQCREFADSGDSNVLITFFNNKMDSLSKGEGEFSISSRQAGEYKKLNKEIVEDKVMPAFKKLAKGIKRLVDKRNGSYEEEEGAEESEAKESAVADVESEAGSGKSEQTDKEDKKLWQKSVGNPQGLALYENGRAYYEFMVKNMTGSSRSVKELDKLLSDTIMQQTKSLRENFLDKETLSLYDESEMPEGEPEALLADLEEKMGENFTPLSQIAKDNNYELSEQDIYTVKYVDKSMEDILSPAFYLTPALDNFDENVIYINKKKMESGESLYATLGHEAYPGHMYQTVYFAIQQKNPLRYLLNFPGYSEGWGTYAEVMSYEMAGLKGKMAGVEKASLILNLSIFGKLDIGVNYYGWSEEDMKAYLSKLGIAKNIDIPKVYGLMVEEPCMYLKYIIGYLEIVELKQKAMVKLGDEYTDKWFHDFFLSTGPAGFGLIGERLKGV